ncbi:MAG: alginate export family protein [Elusimicrobia bacterium]|nr:alginate export family protein [Elusimicrobiota bacterium]
MIKRLSVLLCLALVAGLAGSAYAEVQNVKVSGDITVLGVARSNFDLSNGSPGGKENDQSSFFVTQTRVRLDSDLTDNVTATLRLINERIWSAENNASSDIDLDLAYVTLKEFLYSPLSLKIGRQELIFGNALIVGATNTYDSSVLNTVPGDLSARKSFDALRATLNYDPLVVDTFYAKIDEGSINVNDDVDLYGVNAAYDFGTKGAKAEVYLFSKNDSSLDKNDKVNTLGALLSAELVENLNTSVELAYQNGNSRSNGTHRNAWAMQAMADYTFADVSMKPNLGLGYTYLSGDKDPSEGKNKAWDSMYYDQMLNNIAYAILPFSNLKVINVKGGLKPMEDLSLSAVYGYYMLDKKVTKLYSSYGPSGTSSGYYYEMNDKASLGNALDITATYDYTEDVQFGLTAGMFACGKAFSSSNDRTATQIIGSMKVSF